MPSANPASGAWKFRTRARPPALRKPWRAPTGAEMTEGGPRAARRRDERAGAEHHRLVACGELDLPFEDEERVDVIGVRVRVDDEPLVEVDLDHRQLLGRDADQPVAVGALEVLALAGAADDHVGHGEILWPLSA